MTRINQPDENARRLPGWARQLLWFVALWCMGTGVLAIVAYAIRAVLFA